MNIFNTPKKYFIATMLLVSLFVKADVLIDVTATMVAPPCNISTEDINDPVKIDFGTLDVKYLNKNATTRNLSLYITDCDLTKTLATQLESKNTHTIMYEGRNILGTSTDGLGIDFSEVTGGVSRALEFNKKIRIYPEKLDLSTSRIILEARLVSVIPSENLELGKYSASMIVSILYN